MKENRDFISYKNVIGNDWKKETEGEIEFEKALRKMSERIDASDELKTRIDQELMQTVKEEHGMKRFSVKKIVIGVAAATLMVGTVCMAGSGLKTYVSGGSSAPEYTKFEDMVKAEAEVGYQVDAIAEFRNGFSFDSINVNSTAIINEAGQREEELKEINIRYQKDDRQIGYHARKIFDSEDAASLIREGKIPDKTLLVGDVEVVYNQYTYKFVPVGYELTEEDKENEKRDDYFISEGSEEVEIKQYASVQWVKDEVIYSIAAFDLSMSGEEMLNMAKEVIENGK